MPSPPPGPSSQSYISQRLRLNYVDWGNPDKPPLILVHGGYDHCRNWDWVAAALRDDYHIIAPDLRGHGDSAWSPSGEYGMNAYVYDLAQLIHQQRLAPVKIIAHSMGGVVALRYAGAFPETVSKLVVIEGFGPSPAALKLRGIKGLTSNPVRRLREWVADKRTLAGRAPRRYASIEEAFARMREANTHLTAQQARHLTVHGASQNEDGTYSWKFDNYVHAFASADFSPRQVRELWENIDCPILCVHGAESWSTNPEKEGLMKYFKDVRIALFDNAGHWVHHDRLDAFLGAVRGFL